jgi:acetoin utilization deacetylase AcuC-like enzyme
MNTTPPVRLPVFYCPELTACSAGLYSPSAEKPAALLEAWQRMRLPIRVLAFAPVTRKQLCRAHDPEHVAAILDATKPNGFGTRDAAVARSLPYTSGAMLAAARWVLTHGGIACAPVSGFHHAGYRHVAGFCTFNGLMVTALSLLEEGSARKVGILDCDHHYGDGTDQLLDRFGLRGPIVHISAGERFHLRSQAAEFLGALPSMLRALEGCEVVLYQAGADPHVDDPLGGWLTTEELVRRDEIVLGGLVQSRTPVAWNLAGGYQREPDGTIPKVLEIHTNTALASLRAMGAGASAWGSLQQPGEARASTRRGSSRGTGNPCGA